MITFEVRLKRTITVTSRVKVEVESDNKMAAGAKAIALAEAGEAKWSEALGDVPVVGAIEIEQIDPVIDHDFAEEEIDT